MQRYIKRKSNPKISWERATDVEERVDGLSKRLGLNWIKTSRVMCFRSKNSKSRATARIWGLNRFWQEALKEEPMYMIEVLEERFDRLDRRNQDKVLLHELTHIPRNFSGALIAHTRKGKSSFKERLNDAIRSYEKGNI